MLLPIVSPVLSITMAEDCSTVSISIEAANSAEAPMSADALLTLCAATLSAQVEARVLDSAQGGEEGND